MRQMTNPSPSEFAHLDAQQSESIPFALVSKDGGGLQIVTPNAVARAQGIHRNMRLADARALVPALETQASAPREDRKVLCGLVDWCQRYTPLTAVDGDDGLLLDVTGATHLLGGEEALLQDLEQRLRKLDFEHQIGLASTSGAAWAVARFGDPLSTDKQIVPSDRLRDALAPLPLDALRLNDETLYLLKRFGLDTIRALDAVPRVSLKRRFPSQELHEAVLHRLDQALGRSVEPVVAQRAVPAYCEYLSFADPILATESFHLGLKTLLVRLTRRMEQDRKGAVHLTLAAWHVDGGVSRITIATANPSRDTDHLTYLFRDRIEKINPGFGIDLLALSADTVEAMDAEQLALPTSGIQSRNNEELNNLVDRLSNRLGEKNVTQCVSRESHIPERTEMRLPVLGAHKRRSAGCLPDKPPRPLRLLKQPEPVTVVAEVPEGPPRRFVWRRVTHDIVKAEGPERIAPEWWELKHDRHVWEGCTRDYYRVEDEKGQRFWLFRAGLYDDVRGNRAPSWHVHGMFA